MLKRFAPLFVFFAIASCGKNSLNTNPEIELKSMNSDVFPGGSLKIDLQFRDKEGDLGEGLLVYIRQRLNSRNIPDYQSNNKADTITTQLPEFPKSTTGTFEITMPYEFLTEDPDDNDTMVFHIHAVDLAGNSSDTIVTPVVVEHQQ